MALMWKSSGPSDATFGYWQAATAAATPTPATRPTAGTTAAAALQSVFLVSDFFSCTEATGAVFSGDK
jgi:hypothetical protein